MDKVRYLTKVEDTRDLLDNVLYLPTQGRYKIYLIDEVHMLSNHSFNALLKTLEEPPLHVKFLLATTDPKRLPITILSRCLQFHLKPISSEHIAKHLQSICHAENLSYEIPALEKLATSAEGSMRDALSLLDQAIAYGQGSVNKNDVYAMLSSLAQDELFPLLQALIAKEGKALFDAIAQLTAHAPNFHQVLDELISLFHQLAIQQIVPDALESNETLIQFAKQLTPEEIQLYYQIALLGKRDLAFTASLQQGFEMTMLRMLAFNPHLTEKNSSPSNPTPKSLEAPVILQKNRSTAAPSEKMIGLFEWRDLLPKLELSGMAYALASNCILDKITENKIELALSATHQPMLNQKLKDRIAEALSHHLKQPIQLEINITHEALSTPIKLQKQEQETRLSHATQTVLSDPKIKQLIEMYDATIEVSLVT